MLVIFYTKANSEIIDFRDDQSLPPLTVEEITNNFFLDHSNADNSIGHAVVAGHKFEAFNFDKFLYNESTGVISDNPNYVAPTPAPEPEPI
jgi:hypothetical protein